MENLLPMSDWHKNRLELIKQSVQKFWGQKIYNHYTNQGVRHSERVYRLITELATELPVKEKLSDDEAFILASATWLYEIGMQSSKLKDIPNFEVNIIEAPTPFHLNLIRENRHFLSQKLILGGNNEKDNRTIALGINAPLDQFTFLIAEVCRWCSSEPLSKVPESGLVNGATIRVRLLVALLRLADQLYIDNSRINFETLKNSKLPLSEYTRYFVYHYVSILPIENGEINFQYLLPSSQSNYLPHIRALIENEFEFDNNYSIQYLSREFHLRLLPPRKPRISSLVGASTFPMIENDILTYLDQNFSHYKNSSLLVGQVESKKLDLTNDVKITPTLNLSGQSEDSSEEKNVNMDASKSNLTGKKESNSKINNFFLFLWGLFPFMFLVIAMYFILGMRLITWISPIVNWLTRFSNPQNAHWLLSISIASMFWLVIYGLLKIGGKLTIKSGGIVEIESETVSITHPVLSTLFSIPIWLIVAILIWSSFSLYYLRPDCQAPTIVFQAIGDENIIIPNQIIKAPPNSSLVLKAVEADNTTQILRCRWIFTGASIEKLEQPNSCLTTIYFSNVPGDSIVSVNASKDFCDIYTSTSITISTNP